MCCNPIILQQWYDDCNKFHCHYYADYNPDEHSERVLKRLSLGLHRQGMHKHKFVVVPCGKCVECIRRKARDWKIRLYHHSLTEGDGIFVTLTYNDDNMDDGSLNYRHFQLFMKRLRRNFPDKKISFFCSGEYGVKTLRRHFHCLIFGLDINDVKTKFLCCSRRAKDVKIWTSDIILKCWDNRGHVSVSRVFSGDARVLGYVSGYMFAKSSDIHRFAIINAGLEPEFHHMSLKPAIGKNYFLLNFERLYENDFVVFNSKRFALPRAYDVWYRNITSRFVIRAGVGYSRYLDAIKRCSDKLFVTSLIFQSPSGSFLLDKVSDFDIIKKKRKERFLRSASTGTDFNLSSRKYNYERSLYFCNRDLDIGGAYA